ncbi:DUF2971 domain-containing protein [Pseudoalteromonas sp. MMG007]|uniref:DUF2971 domain-containing protein n=1 Tax=Pseudoalteromonas sp. MMG007 TaxID=2822684 RepID=UPI001B390DD8|nr:DUF2971 domain-containing protein [Pseudoalteromonas sp. MMG007]MBQ4859248.1 DUF2971 domain-containing protein [Pseudoalteromonas sp. MMG007]
MSLYKYISVDTLFKILEGNIRLTQPSAFNDPFELLSEINIPEGLEKQDLDMRFDLMSPARVPPVGELPYDFKSPTCNDDTARTIRSDLDNSIGILCLTKNPNSVLMWSHYAEEYAGVMIEFDRDHEFFEGLFEIDYRKNRAIKDYSFFADSEEPIRLSELCIKPKDWEYEQEVRIARPLVNCVMVNAKPKYPIYVMDLPSECIKSITFGERTSIENQISIFNKVKNTNISLSLSAISNWGFNFRLELIKYNVPISEMSPVISPRTAHIFKDLPGQFGEIARWQIKNNKFSKLVNKTV